MTMNHTPGPWQAKDKPPIGMPGIGASLGQCALCGQSFVVECCLGRPVRSFTWEHCQNTLFAHSQCIEKLPDKSNLDVLTLPDTSPLRRAYEKTL